MENPDRTRKKPFTIVFCHQKGGVGKTSSSVSLGACFAERGYSTLLVDLDASGNLTSGIGYDPDTIKYSIADVFMDSGWPGKAILRTPYSNIDLLPSNPNLVQISDYLHTRSGYEFFLQDVLREDRIAQYQRVVLDCPPVLDALTITALTAADLAVLPTPCEYFSLQAMENVFELIRLIRAKTNPLLRYRLLITMFDGRGKFHRHVLEQIRMNYGSAVLQTVIGFDTRIRESQMMGVPVLVHAPKTRSASQYRMLAEELEAYA